MTGNVNRIGLVATLGACLAVVCVALVFACVQWRAAVQAANAAEEASRRAQARANTAEVGRTIAAYARTRRHAIADDVEDAERGLEALTFLVGTWRGEHDGEFVEEIWSSPRGGAMMGMFRWLNADGAARMYELLTITKEGDETFLRLRHFNRAMHAWEDKDAPVELTLSDIADGVAVFENVDAEDRMARIEFRRIDDAGLGIDVIFREDRDMAPLRFRFEREASK